MKIAIFETDHFEAAYPVIRLFDNGQNDITIFTYETSYKQLQLLLGADKNRYKWVVRKKGQSKISFIYTMYKAVRRQKADFLYLNTISDNFIFYSLLIQLLSGTRMIVTLHIINSFFYHHTQFSLRRIIRITGKKMLIKSAKEFNVLSETMVPLLAKRLPVGKKIHCIPGGISEMHAAASRLEDSTKNIHLVIAGSIDEKRRDYSFVFDLLNVLHKKQLPVSITFLGKFTGSYGENIHAKCMQWNSEYVHLFFYGQEEIQQTEFDKVLSTATFIFIPSVITSVIEDDIEEVYGKTICSGNLSDAIRHTKPIIIPQGLLVDPALEERCFRYNTLHDITDFIESAYSDSSILTKLKGAAQKSSFYYSIEQIRERNPSVFNI
jgi:glycosyltransferase involved in cell wall biosynthesis